MKITCKSCGGTEEEAGGISLADGLCDLCRIERNSIENLKSREAAMRKDCHDRLQALGLEHMIRREM